VKSVIRRVSTLSYFPVIGDKGINYPKGFSLSGGIYLVGYMTVALSVTVALYPLNGVTLIMYTEPLSA